MFVKTSPKAGNYLNYFYSHFKFQKMPKSKLKIKNVDLGKFLLACEVADVVPNEEESREIGDTTIIPIAFKTPAQVFELGRYIDKIKV